MDQTVLYDILYALAARDGREAVLFGSDAPRAHEAFVKASTGAPMTEIWFELPLLGDPWFDLHVFTSHDAAKAGGLSYRGLQGHYANLLDWFQLQEHDVRDLVMSFDVHDGSTSEPAAQLLMARMNPSVERGFLEAAGRAEAVTPFRTFVERMPESWFACYMGIFPGRQSNTLRAECIVDKADQKAYAEDAGALEAHLRQAGMTAIGETVLERCQELARTPFKLEFQFDIMPDGAAGGTFSASVRFAFPSDDGDCPAFDPEGAGGELLERVCAWGLADERWKLLADTAFAKRVSRGGDSTLIYCGPAFVKLKWRDGEPVDAKTYLMAGAQ